MINNNNAHFEDVKKRLTALETLKDLLTPDEYQKKRADIVASIGVDNEDDTEKNKCQDKEEEEFIPTATAEPVPLQNTSSTTVNIVMPQSVNPVTNTTSFNTAGSVYAGGTVGAITKIRIGSFANLCITVQTAPWDGFAIRAGQDLILWPSSVDSQNHQNWLYNPADQTIVLASRPELCLTVVGLALKVMLKILVPSPFQRWIFNAANGSINLASDPTTVISVATVTPYIPTFQQMQKIIVWKNIGPALSQKWQI